MLGVGGASTDRSNEGSASDQQVSVDVKVEDHETTEQQHEGSDHDGAADAEEHRDSDSGSEYNPVDDEVGSDI